MPADITDLTHRLQTCVTKTSNFGRCMEQTTFAMVLPIIVILHLCKCRKTCYASIRFIVGTSLRLISFAKPI